MAEELIYRMKVEEFEEYDDEEWITLEGKNIIFRPGDPDHESRKGAIR